MEIGVVFPGMSRSGEMPGDGAEAARYAPGSSRPGRWASLIAGTGVPFADSIVALAAAAGVT